MNFVYRIQGVDFEWDTNKAESNFVKHGVTFAEAAEVFFDPFYQEGDASANNEQRDFILGYSLSQRLSKKWVENPVLEGRLYAFCGSIIMWLIGRYP